MTVEREELERLFESLPKDLAHDLAHSLLGAIAPEIAWLHKVTDENPDELMNAYAKWEHASPMMKATKAIVEAASVSESKDLMHLMAEMARVLAFTYWSGYQQGKRDTFFSNVEVADDRRD